MSMIRSAAVAAACAVLAACGGGGQEPAPVKRAAQAVEQVALFVGDSTFAASYAGEPRTPDLVSGIATIDAAVSGSTSCAADVALILSTGAAVVVANYSINDSVVLTDAQYVGCMGRIAQAAQDAGSVLVLVEANPIVPGGSWSSHHDHAAVRQKEAQKLQVAMQWGAYYCQQPALPWSLELVPDGVHPGPLAKPGIAAAISQCIARARGLQ